MHMPFSSALRPERPFDVIDVMVCNMFDCSQWLYRNAKRSPYELTRYGSLLRDRGFSPT